MNGKKVSTKAIRKMLGRTWASELATEYGVSRKTVHKAVAVQDFDNPVWEGILKRMRLYDERQTEYNELVAKHAN